MCYIDTEPCSVWRESYRQARKPYKCACCRAPIAVGERYLYHFDVFEGDACQERLCLSCEADRETFADAHGGRSSSPSSFLHFLDECVSEDEESEQKWRPMLERIHARMEGR